MDVTDLVTEMFKRPELVGVQFLVLKLIGAVCSALATVTLYFIKKLISEVKKSINVTAQLAYQMQTLTERLGAHERSQKENYEGLSERVRKLEISAAIIEREILRKKGHNETVL